MYKLKPEAANWEPIAGVPWREMSDEEYAAISAQYDAQFPDQPGSLERWFEHVPDGPTGQKSHKAKED